MQYVQNKERPLALYWFGENNAKKEKVLNETISGGVSINDCAWHVIQEDIPFGGVGPSGMGAYHGDCLLYTSPSPRDATLSRMPSSA